MIRWRDVAGPPPPRPVAEFLAGVSAVGRTGGEALRVRVAALLAGAAGASDLRESVSGSGPASAVVALERTAREEAWRAVAGSRVERGGLLIGEPFARSADDAGIALVHVRKAVPGGESTASGVSLRMEASVWSSARARLGPGELVVGWYHSHPAIGAFFSDTDRRTQAAFFTHPFSVGWVIDPFRGEEAWFAGAGSAPVDPSRLLVLEPAPA